MRIRSVWVVLLVLSAIYLAGSQAAFAKFPASEVPTFRLRAHVTSIKGEAPDECPFDNIGSSRCLELLCQKLRLL